VFGSDVVDLCGAQAWYGDDAGLAVVRDQGGLVDELANMPRPELAGGAPPWAKVSLAQLAAASRETGPVR
jgi:hypothetical protein